MTAAGGDKRPTQGGDKLARCPDSHAEVAGKVGVDKSLVTRWISGARKPTEPQQEKLEALYGIPRSAWLKPAAKSEATPKAPPSSPPRGGSPPPHDDGVEGDPAAGDGNNGRLQKHIRDGMRELELDKELSGVKRAEALKKLVDAQVSLSRSTGENALTMTRIVQHPEFQRVVRLIVEALEPFPEALAKVLAVLKANP